MYNKLFGKIVRSSIWLAPDPHRIVWITLLATMDEDGFADFASVENLAHTARVSVQECQAAIDAFEAPDRSSGNPDNEGRRIERVPGGWIVLNAPLYRAIVTREEGKRLAKERASRYRERKREGAAIGQCNGTSVTQRDATALQDESSRPVTLHHDGVTLRHGRVTQSEAEAEAEASKNTSAASRPRVVNVMPPKPPDPLELTEVRAIYPKRSGSQPWDRAAKACRARLTDGHTWEQMIAGARRYAEYCRATHKLGTEYVMQAATFYGPECHFLSPWDAPTGPTAVGKPQPTPEEVQQAREDYERRKAASVASAANIPAPAAQRGVLPLPDLRMNRN